MSLMKRETPQRVRHYNPILDIVELLVKCAVANLNVNSLLPQASESRAEILTPYNFFSPMVPLASASLNVPDDGDTPLHMMALKFPVLDVVKLLVKGGQM